MPGVKSTGDVTTADEKSKNGKSAADSELGHLLTQRPVESNSMMATEPSAHRTGAKELHVAGRLPALIESASELILVGVAVLFNQGENHPLDLNQTKPGESLPGLVNGLGLRRLAAGDAGATPGLGYAP